MIGYLQARHRELQVDTQATAACKRRVLLQEADRTRCSLSRSLSANAARYELRGAAFDPVG